MTRGPFLAMLAAVVCVLGATRVGAQLAPGRSGFSDSPTTASEEEYWFFVRELGDCLARSKRDRAVALMATAVDSPEEAKAFRTLINRSGNNVCMRNMVRAVIVRAQVRGAIAEGLYKQAGEGGALRRAAMAMERPVVTLHDFADCYVAAHPGEARRLLLDTRLGTKGENERVREMSKDFGKCLPQGRDVRLVPMNVRLALAGALYRTTAGPGAN